MFKIDSYFCFYGVCDKAMFVRHLVQVLFIRDRGQFIPAKM